MLKRAVQWARGTADPKTVEVDRAYLEANLFKPTHNWHALPEAELVRDHPEEIFIIYRYIERFAKERLQAYADQVAALPADEKPSNNAAKKKRQEIFQNVVKHAYDTFLDPSKGIDALGTDFGATVRKSYARIAAGRGDGDTPRARTSDSETLKSGAGAAATEEEEEPYEGEFGEDAEDYEEVDAAEGRLPPTPGSFSAMLGPKFDGLNTQRVLVVLADALAYDAMDSRKIRVLLLTGKNPCSFNDIMLMLTAAIYVGNNPGRLTTKTTDKEIGKRVLRILTSKKIARRKNTSSTLTLARVGISFSPLLWWLRSFLDGAGRLPDSGVKTSTPRVLQDLSLSGIKNKIPGGDTMDNYLIQMNQTLTMARERSLDIKLRTSKEDMEDKAKQWMQVALTGAAKDDFVQSYALNEPETDMEAWEQLYNRAVEYATRDRPMFIKDATDVL